MNCPECGKSMQSQHGLNVHRARMHHVSATRPEVSLECPFCEFTGVNRFSLGQHRRYTHADAAKEGAPATAAEIIDAPLHLPEVTIAGAAVGLAGGVSQRKYPAKDDRHNAEILAGLPWMTWPADVAQCDDALNGIAVGLERTQIASPFWLSLRTYVTALRKRLAAKAAA